MVKRAFLVFVLFFGFVVFCSAQDTGKLGKIAILSFSGGSPDERDGIAELFSFTPQMMGKFVVIPRTTITNAINREQSFQLSGMTDADTMARLGNQFGADFVMSGSITSLGSSQLLIVSIVKIDVIQQVAGDYLVYNSLDDLHKDNMAVIKKMAGNLTAMMGNDSPETDKLAVLPVQFSGGANESEGDALAQLLSIFLMRNEKYAVYPRTKSLEQVQREYTTQLSGQTRGSETVALGRGVNPPYVLSIVSRKIGTGNMFNASVIDLERGNQVAGYSEQYTSLSDGINAINILAKNLSGVEGAETGRDRQVAIDRFLTNAGVSFSGWFGISPAGTIITKEENSSNGNAYTPNILYFGGARVELRLFPFFGIQTGIGAVQKEVEENVNETSLQIPFLARFNIWVLRMGDGYGISVSPYGGIGFNPVSSADSFSKISLILGAEVGMTLVNNIGVFAGYEYNHDFGDTDYGRTSILKVGLSWYVPLRKG